eukprot:comp6394_c0_seq1/m.2194 comp6394_c0_seq1/g.2194  ORF comp6394_c0_seq1/g.2194 comp6394_c0_seq1/m.2194 type:complete len:416 (-) comp6394_c0_seq1:195-1442(-)
MSRYDDMVRGWNPTFSEWMWLVPGTHWKDLEKPEFAHIEDMVQWVAVGIPMILALRYVLERCIFPLIGRRLGVCERIQPIRLEPNAVLEAFYLANKRKTRGGLKSHLLKDLCARTNMDGRSIERWFRRRRQVDVVSPMTKFSESMFKALFYFCTFTYGLLLLLNRPWLWDLRECFREFPYHVIDNGCKFYYAVELSYYASALITLNIDVKRKDFVEMAVHHWATIALLAFSYMANFVRIGTVVLLVHDFADIALETGKCFVYAGWQKAADNIFVVFAAYFFLSRLIAFPYVIYAVLVYAVEEVLNESFTDYITKGHLIPTHAIFSALLLILLCLHIFWMSIILKMAIKFLQAGAVEKDYRSEGEEEEDEISESEDEKKEVENRKLKRNEKTPAKEEEPLLSAPPTPELQTPRPAA